MAVLEATPRNQNAVSQPTSFLDEMSDESKQEILHRLVREVISITGGKCLVPFTTSNGESLGYFVPPAISEAHTQSINQYLTPERIQQLKRAAETPDATFDPMEYLDQLDREDRD